MRRFGRNLLLGMALVGFLGMLPSGAAAVGYEDSLDDCAYPKTFDVAVMRPLSFMTMLAGTALYIPIAPIAFLTVPDEDHQVRDNLIYAPARFTFSRKLGECNGVTVAY